MNTSAVLHALALNINIKYWATYSSSIHLYPSTSGCCHCLQPLMWVWVVGETVLSGKPTPSCLPSHFLQLLSEDTERDRICHLSSVSLVSPWLDMPKVAFSVLLPFAQLGELQLSVIPYYQNVQAHLHISWLTTCKVVDSELNSVSSLQPVQDSRL